MAFLILESPSGERNYFTIREEKTSLGRDARNHIVIESEYVSAFHAEFRSLPDGTMEIVDLDSHNGTEVNDERIEEQVVLRNGDALGFGLVQGCFYEALETPEAGDGDDGDSRLDEAFLPRANRADWEASETPVVMRGRESMEELSGVVLAFEEFDYATGNLQERSPGLLKPDETTSN
tara:strand:+ start:712 stop:1245 length:534 start_codon:yes stop_codon:yes gene_type:complete